MPGSDKTNILQPYLLQFTGSDLSFFLNAAEMLMHECDAITCAVTSVLVFTGIEGQSTDASDLRT